MSSINIFSGPIIKSDNFTNRLIGFIGGVVSFISRLIGPRNRFVGFKDKFVRFRNTIIKVLRREIVIGEISIGVIFSNGIGRVIIINSGFVIPNIISGIESSFY